MIPRHFQIMISLLLLSILIVGIYIIQLRRGEQQLSQQETTIAPAVPQAVGSFETIHVLIAYDDDQARRWRDSQVFMPEDRSLRAKVAMRAVLEQYLQKPSPHPVGKGAAIKEVYLVGSDTLLVDTTAAFADEHPSGILLEEMTLASLIETVSANVPGINKVKFLVEGKERETLAGHADLMSFYQMSAVHELAKELE